MEKNLLQNLLIEFQDYLSNVNVIKLSFENIYNLTFESVLILEKSKYVCSFVYLNLNFQIDYNQYFIEIIPDSVKGAEYNDETTVSLVLFQRYF